MTEFPLFCPFLNVSSLLLILENRNIISIDSHADIEDREVDPELVVPHLTHVDQVLLAARVRPRALICHLLIR